MRKNVPAPDIPRKRRASSTFTHGAMWAVTAISAVILVYLLFGNAIRQGVQRRQLRQLNVILITIDTLRSDHLGCYGKRLVDTPNLDRLAAEGVRFERCIAQTPLTLPSHTTILSGTYPLFHQVRDNGGFLVPQELTLISETLKGNGFTTAGFIGAYVLNSKWGINQGFDAFYDRFDLSKYKTISLGDVQRRADEVLGDARQWLAKNRSRRFFAWIHLYDPHTPYEPPSPFKESYAGHPYRGEVAYTDSELGKFFDFLKAEGMWQNSLIVVTGDHGESLGEHSEGTHGYYVYEATVHVPLLIRAPFRFPVKTVADIVEHVDVMPTLLDALGIPSPASVQGKSLLPLLFGKKANGFSMAYTETYYPRLHYGWSDLKALYSRDWKYILAPQDELYNYGADAREADNLVLKKSVIGKQLRRTLLDFVRDRSRNAISPEQVTKTDRDSLEKLAALGYITSFADTSGKQELVDPKLKIHIYKALGQARSLSEEGHVDEAIATVARILQEDPEIIDAHMFLGNLYFKKKMFAEALGQYRQVLEKRYDYNFAMINVINSLRNMGRLEEAKKEISGFLKMFPRDAAFYTELGEIYSLQKNYDQALAQFFKAVQLDPGQATALSKIGETYFLRKDYTQAESFINRALAINPQLQRAYFNLGLIAEARGNPQAAGELYRRELEVNPKAFRAAYNLAELLRQAGQQEQAVTYYRQALEANPEFNIPYFMIAKYYIDRKENLEEAIRLCQQGVTLRPEDKYTAFGYFVLADIYSYLNQPAQSQENLQKAESIMNRVEK